MFEKKRRTKKTVTSVKVANAEVIEAYEEAKRNPAKKEAYYELLCKKLIFLINKQMTVYGFTRAAEAEDLRQEALTVVISHIDDYDPYLAMPSSYFVYYISEGLKNACSNVSNLSANFLALHSKLNRIAKNYGYEDACDERLSIQKLAELSGESIKTVKSARDQFSITTVSMDSLNGVSATSEGFDNPEKVFLKGEESAFIRYYFTQLSPFAQFCVEKLYLDTNEEGKTASCNEVVRILKADKDLCERFEIKNTPDQTLVQNTAQKALNFLRHCPEFQARYGKRERRHRNESFTVVKQAADEYIESAVAEMVAEI